MAISIIKSDAYVGPERRRAQRRLNGDRRELLRYEPEKENRRHVADRRRAGTWSRLHTL